LKKQVVVLADPGLIKDILVEYHASLVGGMLELKEH